MLGAVQSRCWTTVQVFQALQAFAITDRHRTLASCQLRDPRRRLPRTAGSLSIITGLAERGVDLKAIAEIAGHTSIRTTAMDCQVKPEAARADIAGRNFQVVRCPLFRSLLGAKRTCRFALHMSANDPKRTLAVHCGKGF